MSTAELNKTKIDLIQWISNLSDDNFIEIINSFRLSESKNDWWNELNNDEKNQLRKGLNDIQNNQVMDSQTFWNELDNE